MIKVQSWGPPYLNNLKPIHGVSRSTCYCYLNEHGNVAFRLLITHGFVFEVTFNKPITMSSSIPTESQVCLNLGTVGEANTSLQKKRIWSWGKWKCSSKLSMVASIWVCIRWSAQALCTRVLLSWWCTLRIPVHIAPLTFSCNVNISLKSAAKNTFWVEPSNCIDKMTMFSQTK